MLEPSFRVQSAAGQQRVFQAHGGGFAKGSPYVKVIISFQIAAVNDAEDLHPVIQPVSTGELIGNAMKLPSQPFRGGDIVDVFQRVCGGGFIALIHFPSVGRFGMLPCAGVRNVEHIPQFGVSLVGSMRAMPLEPRRMYRRMALFQRAYSAQAVASGRWA